MNLIVDIGNTRVKYALMERDNLLAESSSEGFSILAVEQLVAEAGGENPGGGVPCHAIVASTRGDETEVVSLLRAAGWEVLLFDASTEVPLRCDYLTPETLGRDRLAAAVGAESLYPGRSMLIVDFGTAITCDWVSAGCYHGGFISPGMQSRFRALNEFTARLPRVEPPKEVLAWGRSTEECIGQGVMQGICYEIEGHIARFGRENPNLLVIFTGGDAKHFEKRIKNTIFADCDLVFLGLNRILEHHILCR